MRRIHEGAGFHTITQQDLIAEKALSILNSTAGVPQAQAKGCILDEGHAIFHGLVLQEHLDGAENAVSQGKLDVLQKHAEGIQTLRHNAR